MYEYLKQSGLEHERMTQLERTLKSTRLQGYRERNRYSVCFPVTISYAVCFFMLLEEATSLTLRAEKHALTFFGFHCQQRVLLLYTRGELS